MLCCILHGAGKLKIWLDHQLLPDEQQTRIMDFFHSKWMSNRQVDYRALVAEMPPQVSPHASQTLRRAQTAGDPKWPLRRHRVFDLGPDQVSEFMSPYSCVFALIVLNSV